MIKRLGIQPCGAALPAAGTPEDSLTELEVAKEARELKYHCSSFPFYPAKGPFDLIFAASNTDLRA